MHSQPMSEDQGEFGEWKPAPWPCPNCKVTGQLFYRIWKSSDGAFEDEKSECRACGKVWWIDGIDS